MWKMCTNMNTVIVKIATAEIAHLAFVRLEFNKIVFDIYVSLRAKTLLEAASSMMLGSDV